MGLLALLVLLQFQPTFAKERMLYVGQNSTEAILTYDGEVHLSFVTDNKDVILNHIENQVQHLFGPMGESHLTAVPRGNHGISQIKVKKISSQEMQIKYRYTGTIVVKNSKSNIYPVILPKDPDQVFYSAMIGDKNPCTDPHYQSSGDFWYFWSPHRSGCKLKENEDYYVFPGKLQKIKNSVKSYPEYDRLGGDAISIRLIMGMDEPEKGKDPNSSTDINADNFRSIKETLIESGWKNQVWSAKEKSKIMPRSGTQVYLEKFTKLVTNGNKSTLLVIDVFFGPTGIQENSKAFHYYFKDSLENGDVVMYDGHSGLGGHLDLVSIERMNRFTIMPPKDKYQIYFFNSCSSYSYYNTMFFDRKKTARDPKGTKNLDILTNGLATYFYVMHDTNLALIQAIQYAASGIGWASYQTLAKQIDSGNLFGVNGDEDNPTR